MVENDLRSEYKNTMIINIVEKSGISLNQKFQSTNPFKNKHRGEKICMSCDGQQSIKCRKQGVGYDLSCFECRKKNKNSKYIGETGRNG